MFSQFRAYARRFGPGIVTGASDDDPAGIATYSQAGVLFGLSTLWMCLVTIPLMISVQEMSARISLVTGRGLVANMLSRYSRRCVTVMVVLLAFANVINLGADLGMMAAAAKLIIPLPFFTLLIAFTLLTLLLQLLAGYRVYAKYLKWLTLSLLAYIIVAAYVRIQWSEALLYTLVPTFHSSKDYWLMFVAILGTTISHYLYFWEANQTVEEEKAHHHAHTKSSSSQALLVQDITAMRADVSIGMIASNVVAWFIILTAGVVLYGAGITNIVSADQAAGALAPLAGQYASLLFVIGIVGTGLLTLPILSGGVAYAVSELFHQTEGLGKSWHKAPVFYLTMVIATLIGLGMNAFGINPVRALIISSVGNAIIAAPILYIILRIGNDQKIMGKQVNGFWSNLFGTVTCLVMGGSSLVWLFTAWI